MSGRSPVHLAQATPRLPSSSPLSRFALLYSQPRPHTHQTWPPPRFLSPLPASLPPGSPCVVAASSSFSCCCCSSSHSCVWCVFVLRFSLGGCLSLCSSCPRLIRDWSPAPGVLLFLCRCCYCGFFIPSEALPVDFFGRQFLTGFWSSGAWRNSAANLVVVVQSGPFGCFGRASDALLKLTVDGYEIIFLQANPVCKLLAWLEEDTALDIDICDLLSL